MDKLKQWLEDPKNQPKAIAIIVPVLALLVVGLLFMTGVIGGGGGGGSMAMDPSMQGTTGDPNAMPPGTDPNAAPAAPGVPGDPNAAPPAPGVPGDPNAAPPAPGVPGDPNAAPSDPNAPAGAAPAAGGAATAKMAPMLPYRKDPFAPLGGMPTKKDVMSVLLPSLRRPRIAPAPVYKPTEGPEVVEALPPQPMRRMAGVLWNGRVSAILETNGETDIVRPGMEINKGNSRVRVESITQDSIILKTLDTRVPMTIKVGMGSSISGNSASAGAPNQGGDGGPEMYPNGPY